MGKRITNEDRSVIAELLSAGMSPAFIEKNAKLSVDAVSQGTISSIKNTYTAAKAKDYKYLAKLYDAKRAGPNTVKWACEYVGLNWEEVEANLYEIRVSSAPTPPAPQPQPEPSAPAPAAPTDGIPPATLTDLEAAVHAAAGKLILKMEDLSKQVDLLAPCLQGIVKQMNVNFDIVVQEMKKQTDLLQGIKSNSRPRFSNKVQ